MTPRDAQVTKLVYLSRRLDRSAASLERIMEQSRANNRVDGVTGLLLHDAKHFMQILEGSYDAVARCFLRIACNPKHSEIQIGLLGASPIRVFAQWDMQSHALAAPRPTLVTLWRRIQRDPEPARLEMFEQVFLQAAAGQVPTPGGQAASRPARPA